MKKRITFILIFSVAISLMSFDLFAASKPAKVKSLTVSVQGSVAHLSWSKVKGAKGYQVIRDGVAVTNTSARSYSESNSGSHTYQVRAYKTQKQYYNTKKHKWVTKKPKASQWVGKQTKTKYFYGKKSPAKTANLPVPTPTPTSTPTPDDTIQTKTITTTNYLGQTFTTTLYRKKSDPDKMYLLPSCIASSEYTGVVRAEKDKNYDYTWQKDGTTYVQKNGIRIHVYPDVVAVNEISEGLRASVYNGDLNRLKFTVTDSVVQYNSYNWDKEPITEDAVKSGQYILTTLGPEKKTGNTKYITFYTGNSWIGFVSGDVHIRAWYDFNNDGSYSSDEFLANMTYHVNKDPDREFALNICKAAVAQAGTNSYDADMFAICDYIEANYKYGEKVSGSNHLKMECDDGAFILETWSIWKYGVYGYQSYIQQSNSSHVAFWPLNNPYSVHAYFDAQGH